ncbi:hypothetical protein [Phycicoccus flavus]|uniref:Uncharacterized protein n=1 Tax=Phycicoccus flavus TaxID=2502783 RepID=A0A8T6R340_9MICO|nr:hypothetical protein [Phycicoccus flavus]NHA68053.1 hypothetical protein [Phycicoccus flavus]
MSAQPAARRRRSEREVDLAARRRVAELWRATGLGFTIVWTVLLVLVVGFWVRVTFLPRPGDDLPGSLQVLLAPVAVISAGMVVWGLVCGWRLLRRRTSGWDAVVVLGAFAIAVAVMVWAPGRFLDSLDKAPTDVAVALVVLGVASVGTGLLGQRAFRRASTGLEPSDVDEYEYEDEEPVPQDGYGDPDVRTTADYPVQYADGPSAGEDDTRRYGGDHDTRAYDPDGYDTRRHGGDDDTVTYDPDGYDTRGRGGYDDPTGPEHDRRW